MQQSKNVSGKKHRKKGILSYFCKFCQADHKLRFSSRPISRYGGGKLRTITSHNTDILFTESKV